MLRVPLVRVEGKGYSINPHLSLTPARFAAAERLEREARDQVARDAEAAFGLEASLYFYAGVAHPDFGDVVLAYHPEASAAWSGSATTFDTGGMYLGLIKGRGLSTPPDRKAYVDADRCDLDAWRARTSIWVEEQFASIDDYLEPGRRPASTDPEDRLGHPDNERRAWTVEVRMYADRDIFEDLAFAIVGQEFLQQALASSDSSPLHKERLLRLIADRRILYVEMPGRHPCAHAVAHIKSYIEASKGPVP